MADVLQCTDQWGRRIVLTNEVWFGHILVDHAEMGELQDLIVQCLERPDVVKYDRDFEDRESFYLLDVAGTRGNRHIKVCVDYGRQGVYGDIRTAFITKKVKESEETKWRRGD